MKQKYIKEFKVDVQDLSAEEKKVVNLLVEAAKLIAPIYEKQVNDRYPGANFYPHDATRDEIEKAAQKDPTILDPYTVVERKNGKLITVPYHVKYKKELEPIVKLLKEATKIAKNKEWAKRLEFQAEALLNGTYEASDIYWLTMKPYKLDIVIGPIERYDDSLFFKKTAYQAWVGIMDEKITQEAIKFKNAILSARRRVIMPSRKVDFLDKIQIRVDETLIFSGLIGKFIFGGVNLPNDANLMEKYGSEIMISKSSLKFRFGEYRPILEKIFDKQLINSYSQDCLGEASIRNTYLHELCHSLLRYGDSEERLDELFPIIDEISAYVLGIKSAGFLLLKDFISQKELEAIIIMFLCRAFRNYLELETNPSRLPYVKGYASVLNNLFENRALHEKNGFLWLNFTKAYIVISELTSSLERILSVGNYEDAKRFVQRYGSLEVFERFKSRLKKDN